MSRNLIAIAHMLGIRFREESDGNVAVFLAIALVPVLSLIGAYILRIYCIFRITNSIFLPERRPIRRHHSPPTSRTPFFWVAREAAYPSGIMPPAVQIRCRPQFRDDPTHRSRMMSPGVRKG